MGTAPAATLAWTPAAAQTGLHAIEWVAESGASGFASCPTLVRVRPAPHTDVVTLDAARLWIGLRDPADNGTPFDLKAEIYRNGTLVSETLQRCLYARPPEDMADRHGIGGLITKFLKRVEIPFSTARDVALEPGDEIAIRLLARIGTQPSGARCPGRASSIGLRVYYDSIVLDSNLRAHSSDEDLRLYLDSTLWFDFLDADRPRGLLPRFRDTDPLRYQGGNPWRTFGTWKATQE